MLQITDDPKLNAQINSQIEYHVNKYKNHYNENILRTKAEIIARDALKTWNPSKGNIKTYLNQQLQQLYREVNSHQTVYIPENQLQTMHKAKKIILDYQDTYGHYPSEKELAKELKITEKKAKNMLYMVDGTSRNIYETEGSGAIQEKYTPKEIINSINDPLHRKVATDLYLKEKHPSVVQNKYNIKQTKFYEIKKNIDNHINSFSERQNTIRE